MVGIHELFKYVRAFSVIGIKLIIKPRSFMTQKLTSNYISVGNINKNLEFIPLVVFYQSVMHT